MITITTQHVTTFSTITLTKQYVAYGEMVILCSVISQGKVVALDK